MEQASIFATSVVIDDRKCNFVETVAADAESVVSSYGRLLQG